MNDRRSRIKAIIGEAAGRKAGHDLFGAFPGPARLPAANDSSGRAEWLMVALALLLLALLLGGVELLKWSLPVEFGLKSAGLKPALWFLAPGLAALVLGAVSRDRAEKGLPLWRIDELPGIILRSPRWWPHVLITLGLSVLAAQVIVFGIYRQWMPLHTDFYLPLPLTLIGCGAAAFLTRTLWIRRKSIALAAILPLSGPLLIVPVLMGLILIGPVLIGVTGCASGPALSDSVVPPEGYVPPFETMQVDASLLGMSLVPTPPREIPAPLTDESSPDEPPKVPVPAWVMFSGALAVVLEFAAGRAGG